MATFYLLPPRANLDQSLADLLGRLLPGLPVPEAAWDDLVGRLSATWPDDVFLIPQDDLPDGESPNDALVTDFGAEPGDRVVEVGGARPARSWVVGMSGAVAAR
jgi:hypothetical protein